MKKYAVRFIHSTVIEAESEEEAIRLVKSEVIANAYRWGIACEEITKEPGNATPIELLRYLLDENGISIRQFGDILGIHRIQAAKILRGEREISLEKCGGFG